MCVSNIRYFGLNIEVIEKACLYFEPYTCIQQHFNFITLYCNKKHKQSHSLFVKYIQPPMCQLSKVKCTIRAYLLYHLQNLEKAENNPVVLNAPAKVLLQ